MERWSGKVALVTGASSGIGLSIAKGLAKNGIKVVAVARRINLLKEIEKQFQKENDVTLKCMKCDVTKENEVKEVMKWIENKWGGTSILVNSAGVFLHNPIIDGSAETVTNIFATNVFGMTNFTREVIRSMKKFNIDEGHIININSICGHHIPTSPTLGVHSASKYAITVLTESLKNELALAKLPVRATSISPGLVATEMTSQVHGSEGLPKIQPEDVMNCVLFVLSTPKHVMVTELTVQPVGELLGSI